jgi:hypothetical protein
MRIIARTVDRGETISIVGGRVTYRAGDCKMVRMITKWERIRECSSPLAQDIELWEMLPP